MSSHIFNKNLIEKFSVYILTTKNYKLFYTGYSKNLKQRIKQHKYGDTLLLKSIIVTNLFILKFSQTKN
jgi:predicted GIY-YIG superfamily endonuclease